MSTWSEYVDNYCDSLGDNCGPYEEYLIDDEPDADDSSPDDFVTYDFFELESSKDLPVPEVYNNYIL